MTAGASSGAVEDLTHVPAAPPPPGVIPDFQNPDNYKQANVILHSVVLSASTIAVLIRIYTRNFITRSMGTDDWLAILSWALALEFSIVMAYATAWGFGMHTYDISASDAIYARKWLAISQRSYFPLILSAKLCLLIGYLRIFKVDRMTKWAIWAGIVACSIFYIITFFLDLFRCKPIQASWDPTVEGTCIDYSALPWATGIFNIISDFYILWLPLPPVLRMNMPLARKIRIALTFGLGLFTCVASILRFVVSLQYIQDPDQTYVAAKVLHWTILEINIGIICACAATFHAFFDAGAPRSLGSLVASLLADRSLSRVGSANGGQDGRKGSE